MGDVEYVLSGRCAWAGSEERAARGLLRTHSEVLLVLSCPRWVPIPSVECQGGGTSDVDGGHIYDVVMLDLYDLVTVHDVHAFDGPSHSRSIRVRCNLFDLSDFVMGTLREMRLWRVVSQSFGGGVTTYGTSESLVEPSSDGLTRTPSLREFIKCVFLLSYV